MQRLQSRTAEKVKALCRLRDSAKERAETGCFLAEGLRLCRDIAQYLPARELYATEKMLAEHPELTALAAQTFEISDAVAEKLSDTKTTQGVFALFERPAPLEHLRPGGRYLALEHVQDPANLGALLRSASAFGFEGVLLCSHCADWFSPKVLRAGMGAVAKLGYACYDDVGELAKALKAVNIPLYAAALERAVSLEHAPALTDAGLAVLIGNEGNGLTSEAVALADVTVRIPMMPNVESLNAAVAGSILLWHFRSLEGAAQ